ncbi:MAG TPA: XRE family transcriptional regulator [Bacteroidetes bacterium]|nr:XRE family transcriptional regulator [Bacteroidota bacterium]
MGKQIRKLRTDKGLPLRKVAALLDIDQSILSKTERGERKASKDQIKKIRDYDELLNKTENDINPGLNLRKRTRLYKKS